MSASDTSRGVERDTISIQRSGEEIGIVTSNTNDTQPVADESASGVQSQPQVIYVAPPKRATYPALELGMALFSVIASTWLTAEALAGALALFGERVSTRSSAVAALLSYTEGYVGAVVMAVLAVMFAVLAVWLFGRLKAAVEDSRYKAVLQTGVGIAVVTTLVFAGTTVAVGVTPLLTIQDGSNVGPVYLYDFLPLLLSTGLFALVTWYLLKIAGRQQVGKVLSTIVLVAASVVFVLAFVAVIVKSHDTGASSTTDTMRTPSLFDSEGGTERDTQRDETDRSTRGSSGSTSECYDEYRESNDLSEYSSCLQRAYGTR